jgi:hypothetical protein
MHSPGKYGARLSGPHGESPKTAVGRKFPAPKQRALVLMITDMGKNTGPETSDFIFILSIQ